MIDKMDAKRCLQATFLLVVAACAADACALTPNDPYYATYQTYLQTMGAPTAWDYSTGSTGVKIAVLDSGVIATTPDLAGRVLPGMSVGGLSISDGTANHHGTWVSSAAAMGVNNGVGGAGVGNFSILPITAVSNDGVNSSDNLAAGITLAANQGAKVICISHTTLFYSTVDVAAAAVADKALVFMAAGNSNSRLELNPNAPNLVFVSGTTGNDRATWSGSGSSWGPMVDLCAPATSVLVAEPNDPVNFPSGYATANGTSFSAPLAAGAAALAWSINPNLTPAEVRGILYRTADDLGTTGWDEYFGNGRVNYGAVAIAAAATVPEPSTLVLLGLGALALGVGRGVRGRRSGVRG